MEKTSASDADAKYEGVKLVPVDEELIGLLPDNQKVDPSTIIEYLLRDEFCLDMIERSGLDRVERVRELIIQSMSIDNQRITNNTELIEEVEQEAGESGLSNYQELYLEELQRENEIRDEIASVKWDIARSLDEHIEGGDGVDE